MKKKAMKIKRNNFSPEAVKKTTASVENFEKNGEATADNVRQINSDDLEQVGNGDVSQENYAFSERFKNSLKTSLIYFVIFLGAFLIAFGAYFILKPTYSVEEVGTVAQSVAVFGLIICVILIFVLKQTHELTPDKLIILILVGGFILRLAYMLYTPVTVRQQDTFTKNYDGHAAYADIIFSTGKLPQTNDYQFYHPPLNALAQAAFMHFIDWLTPCFNSLFGKFGFSIENYLAGMPDYECVTDYGYYLYSATQILAVMYSAVTMVTLVKTMRLFEIKGYTLAALAALVVFFPRHIQFSGQVNNDAISYMFQMLAFYYCIKWWKNGKKLLHLMLCSLFIGLGMMAKISCATIALPIAAVFIYEFVCTLKRAPKSMPLWKTVVHYGLFLCVCAPIGLWFQVYAKIKFDQPFGYVFSNLNHRLYTGEHSLFSRLFITFNPQEYFGSLYCRPFDYHYNLFLYSLRSSLFGEFSYNRGNPFAVSALVTAFIAAVMLAVSVAYCAILYFKNGKKTDNTEQTRKDIYVVMCLTLSQIISEIYFYVKMPYGCTMDFRYIMPIILGVVMTYYYTQKRLKTVGTQTANGIACISSISVYIMTALMIMFYCVCI